MAIFAVRQGRQIGKFYSWADCAKQVLGVSGSEYKKFENEAEADKYLGIVQPMNRSGLVMVNAISDMPAFSEVNGENWDKEHIKRMPNEEYVAFIGGSYNKDTECSGYGCLLYSNSTQKVLTGYTNYKVFTKIGGIGGELCGVMLAVKTAKELKARKLTIVFKYQGVQKWVDGSWHISSTASQLYREYMKYQMLDLPIVFSICYGNSNFDGLSDAISFARYSAKSRVTKLDVEDMLSTAVSSPENFSLPTGSSKNDDIDADELGMNEYGRYDDYCEGYSEKRDEGIPW